MKTFLRSVASVCFIAWVTSLAGTVAQGAREWESFQVESLAREVRMNAQTLYWNLDRACRQDPGSNPHEEWTRRRAVDSARYFEGTASNFSWSVMGDDGPESTAMQFSRLEQQFQSLKWDVDFARFPFASKFELYSMERALRGLRPYYF